jgi:predicted NodU family carbamoyl transferase
MIEQFHKRLKKLQAAGVSLVATEQLERRPAADEAKYANKIQKCYELVVPDLAADVSLSVRVVEDERQGRKILTVVLYDNVIANKTCKDDVYRHMLFVDPAKADDWNLLVSGFANWIENTRKALIPVLVQPVVMTAAPALAQPGALPQQGLF